MIGGLCLIWLIDVENLEIKNKMVTFNVDNVDYGSTLDLDKNFNSAANLKNLVGTGVESSSANQENVVTFPLNNFLATINTAYDRHLPLVLTPDSLWLVIAQGLSQHINNNAEELRHQFVNFEGKQTIEIFENSFVKGNADNNWQHAFGQFSDAIKGYIGKKRDLIVGDYSTTTSIDRAANEVVLMESMKKYFNYECTTMCGIPRITLLGTVEDWKNVQNRVKAISEFSLSWWTNHLEPIVQEFVNAANGKVNTSFWQKIYKEGGGSGGPYLSGWATNLFPYLKDYKTGEFNLRNEFSADTDRHFGGLTTRQFPIGMSKVPFVWNYYQSKFDMELAAGFTGVLKNEDGSLQPQVGWVVRDVDAVVTVNVQVDAIANNKGLGWEKEEKIRTNIVNRLGELGWEQIGWSYGASFKGTVAKENFAAIQKIDGVTITKD